MPQVAWGHEHYVPWVSNFNNEATVLPGKARMWMNASWMQEPSSETKGLQVGQKRPGEKRLRMQPPMPSHWALQRLGSTPAPRMPDTQKRKQLTWDSQWELWLGAPIKREVKQCLNCWCPAGVPYWPYLITRGLESHCAQCEPSTQFSFGSYYCQFPSTNEEEAPGFKVTCTSSSS